MATLLELQTQLKEAAIELASLYAPHLSSTDIEDCSDSYQEALELSWYKDELRDHIKDLEIEIKYLTK